MTSNNPTHEILIGLGANLPSPAGPPVRTLESALESLAGGSVRVVRLSPFYETEAWPDPADPAFINAVASVTTDLPPAILLTLLHEVETSFGRKRSAKNAPRPLDLDLLDCGGLVQDAAPRLPHPGIETRAFVLVPLRDVAPSWRHPVSRRSIDELIGALPPAALAGVRRIGKGHE